MISFRGMERVVTCLGPYLVDYMATCQIPNFMRISDGDIKVWSCCLLDADTWLRLPPWIRDRLPLRWEPLPRVHRGSVIVSQV